MPDRPLAEEIRVQVHACGLCGTDLHEYLDGPVLVPVEPHPVTGRCAPLVLGHEIAGRIESLGSAVTGFELGDAVVLNAVLPCGQCESCRDGAEHRCIPLGHLGLTADGGLAEYVTVPAAMAVLVPAHVPMSVAALAEPFAVAVHAVEKAGRPHGSDCLVIGAGTIGIAVGLVLRADGNRVSVLDRDEDRVRTARGLGLDGEHQQARYVFECAGGVDTVATALRLSRAGGLIVLCGLPGRASEIDVADLVLRELRVVGSVGHVVDPDLRRAVEFIAANVDRVAPMVTSVIALEDAVRCGLDVLAGPDHRDQIKIVVEVAAAATH